MSIVVLASGGIDSAVLLARAEDAGKLSGVVWCNYGQPASLHEWRAMHAQLKFLGITAPLHEVPLTTINPGSMCEAAGDPGARVVAARNLIMLAHAVNYAASIGADEVWYGALADDARDYHDCRQEWVRHLNHCTKGDGVAVWSPLISETKAEVVREAEGHGVLKLAWSCYTPRRGEPCGTCNSCKAVQASTA